MSSLTAALALAGLSTLASAAPTGFRTLSRSELSTRDGATLATCLNDARLDPVVQSDSDYKSDSSPFNLRLGASPTALVFPTSANDVAAAVKCAATNGVKVTTRSGGHSYAAFGLGGEDGHLIISLDNLRDITVDADGKASIGAGNRLGDVALGIWEQGERAMAHGVCPYVGIGGHASHGGFGLSSRNWGTLLDQVYEVEVVLADGSIVTANADTQSDLFWAMRGAGPSFGITTTFKTNTHSAPAHNVHFSYNFDKPSAADASSIMQAWQSFGVGLAETFGTQITILPNKGAAPSLYMSGVYSGDDGAAGVNSTWEPLLSKLPIQPNTVSIDDYSWIDSVVKLAGVDSPDGLNTTTAPDTHDTFFADSIYIPKTAQMTADAANSIFDYLWGPATDANGRLNWFVQFDLWGGDKSAITSVGADDTSFDARDSLLSLQLYGSSANGQPPFPDDGITLVEGMKTAITDKMPDVAFKGYSNYVSSELSRDDAHAYYYPTHTPRLQQLKAQFDPNVVFDFPQGFLPASA